MGFQVILKIKCHNIIERQEFSKEIMKVVAIKSSQRLTEEHVRLVFLFKEERLFYNLLFQVRSRSECRKTPCLMHT